MSKWPNNILAHFQAGQFPFNLPGQDDGKEDRKKAESYAPKKGTTDVIRFCGSWGYYSFYIKPKAMLPVKDINISVTLETETKSTNSKENYTALKNTNPAEVSFTAIFNKQLGINNVRKEALKLIDYFRQGKKGYLYIGSTKLYAPMFIGTSAKMSNVEIGAGITWLSCEVAVTFKQCEKYGGGTSGTIESKDDSDGHESSGSSGGGGGSSKGGKKKKPTSKKRSIYDQDDERKKQIQQARERAQETGKAKEESSGYTPTRYTGSGAKKPGASGSTEVK